MELVDLGIKDDIDNNKKIVFVIGAGASADVGLPTGNTLQKQISLAVDFEERLGSPNKFYSKKFNGDQTIFDALERYENISNLSSEMYKACLNIRNDLGIHVSIDDYLHKHYDDPLIVKCGKIAIVQTILQGEASSKIFVNSSKRMSSYEDFKKAWYFKLLTFITGHYRFEDIAKRLNKISFVSFNYDRCIEHYLFHMFKSIYKHRATEEDVINLLNDNLNIYHPYGAVGSLPWQNLSTENKIEFGGSLNAEKLLKLSEGIKTYTEGIEEKDSDVQIIRSNMTSASVLVFLGLHYREPNLDFLTENNRPSSSNNCSSIKYIFGTARDISSPGTEHITNDLIRRFRAIAIVGDGDGIQPSYSTCESIFYNFERVLLDELKN